MAQAQVTDARYVRIWLGASPVATTPAPIKLCAMDRKAFNQTMATNTAVIPDCDDPTLVVPVKRTPISKDATITGAGFFESALRAPLQAMMDDATSDDVCFEIMAPDPNPGWYTGKFFLTTFNIVGNNADGYITAEMTFEADGLWTWVDASLALTKEAA